MVILCVLHQLLPIILISIPIHPQRWWWREGVKLLLLLLLIISPIDRLILPTSLDTGACGYIDSLGHVERAYNVFQHSSCKIGASQIGML